MIKEGKFYYFYILTIGDNLNEIDIIKRLTQKLSVGVRMGPNGHELNCSEERLKQIKFLMRQLVDNKIER